MQDRREYFPQTASFGGDVADLFGSLKDGKEYNNSMNQQGNPFRNDSPEEMVQRFMSKHSSKDNLEITRNLLNDSFGVKPDDKYEELPENYRIANEAFTKKIQEREKEDKMTPIERFKDIMK